MVCQVLICFEQNRKFPVDVCQQEKDLAQTPVLRLKQKIQERRPETEKANMGLIFKTHTLEENHMLAEYGIKHKSEIQAVVRCDGGLELKLLTVPSSTPL